MSDLLFEMAVFKGWLKRIELRKCRKTRCLLIDSTAAQLIL